MKINTNKHTMVGPGGMSCPCCAPQAGSKCGARERKRMKRQALSRFYRGHDKEMKNDLAGDN